MQGISIVLDFCNLYPNLNFISYDFSISFKTKVSGLIDAYS